jgi:predicted nucleotidyltransferase
MEPQDIITILQRHEPQLQRLGVRHVALFGSVARGEAGPNSDIDIAIELDEQAVPDLFAYAGMKRYIAELFPGPVDVVDRAALKPWVRRSSTTDLIYAF